MGLSQNYRDHVSVGDHVSQTAGVSFTLKWKILTNLGRTGLTMAEIQHDVERFRGFFSTTCTSQMDLIIPAAYGKHSYTTADPFFFQTAVSLLLPPSLHSYNKFPMMKIRLYFWYSKSESVFRSEFPVIFWFEGAYEGEKPSSCHRGLARKQTRYKRKTQHRSQL